MGQDLGELIDRDVEPSGQLLDDIAAQDLLKLFRGDREVCPVSNPGFDLIAEAGLLELVDDGGKSALAAAAENLAQHRRKNRAAELAERASKLW